MGVEEEEAGIVKSGTREGKQAVHDEELKELKCTEGMCAGKDVLEAED